MKIAMLASSASRAAAGVFDSTRMLAQALSARGCEVTTFSGRDRWSEVDKEHWGDIQLNFGQVIGPKRFGWQPDLTKRLREYSPDVLHQHGMWMYSSIAATAVAKTMPLARIISPHGMLDAWALEQSSMRKHFAARLYERSNLERAACIHALCESEYHSVGEYGIKVPVAILPNGVDLTLADIRRQPPVWLRDLPNGARVLLFLGRIHPKKGLLPLINAIASLTYKQFSPWQLVIAGWQESGHGDELKALVKERRLYDRVKFIGPQFGDAKYETLSAAHAFVLPSFSEGLPMAVLDAWSFRLPVLMTDACNLPDGFIHKAAWRLTHDSSQLTEQILQFVSLDSTIQSEMGINGRKLVEFKYNWANISTSMEHVYNWCLKGGVAPNCISLL